MIFSVLTYGGRHQERADGARVFEAKLRAACQGLNMVFSGDGKDEELPIKDLDLMEYLKVDPK
jgi:hypothetical protein